MLAQIQAQFISLTIIKPAIGSVLGLLGFGNAASSFGSLFSGAGLLGGTGLFGGGGTATVKDINGNVTGTISNTASLGNSLSGGGGLFGWIGNSINSFGTNLGFAGPGIVNGTGSGAGIFTDLSTGATSDVAGSGVGGLFGGTTLTGALGFAGIGGTVSSLAGLLTGNTGIGSTLLGGAGGLVGGLAGSSLLGSVLGAAAGPLGAIGGGMIGRLKGDLFGAANEERMAA